MVDRTKRVGYCGMSTDIYVARAALHMWEEPPISGTNGSGTIFFSGCSMNCVFCQNAKISHGRDGKKISEERLVEIMLELQGQGAHNINLVTGTHYIPTLCTAIDSARDQGLKIPIVYNTSSYENVEALRMLDGRVNVYLPDFKFYTEKTARALASAPNYFEVADAAIEEMTDQTGWPIFDRFGNLVNGTVVRVLLLPGRVAEAKLIVKHLFQKYNDKIHISLMRQYTPMPGMPRPLNRKVTHEEYRQLVDYACRLGIEFGFVQSAKSAMENYIPDFNGEGV